jgi:hypothetical protein
LRSRRAGDEVPEDIEAEVGAAAHGPGEEVRGTVGRAAEWEQGRVRQPGVGRVLGEGNRRFAAVARPELELALARRVGEAEGDRDDRRFRRMLQRQGSALGGEIAAAWARNEWVSPAPSCPARATVRARRRADRDVDQASVDLKSSAATASEEPTRTIKPNCRVETFAVWSILS